MIIYVATEETWDGSTVECVTTNVDTAVDYFMKGFNIKIWENEKEIESFSSWTMKREDAFVVKHNFLQVGLYGMDNLDTTKRLWEVKKKFSDF